MELNIYFVSKETKELYTENYKILMKEIKDNTKKENCRPISLMNKNPQQNFSKQNSATHQKAHRPWSSCIYSRDARILQYTQINQCDISY